MFNPEIRELYEFVPDWAEVVIVANPQSRNLTRLVRLTAVGLDHCPGRPRVDILGLRPGTGLTR